MRNKTMISTHWRYLLPLSKGNLIAMYANEIKYLHSDGQVVYIMSSQNQQIVGGKSLKFYLDLLKDGSFLQVSPHIIVNLNMVRNVNPTHQELQLVCGKRLHLSMDGLKMLQEHIDTQRYMW